jgi:hypothetical protein
MFRRDCIRRRKKVKVSQAIVTIETAIKIERSFNLKGKAIIIQDLSIDIVKKIKRIEIYDQAFQTTPKELTSNPIGIYIHLEDGSILSSWVFERLETGNARFCSFNLMTCDELINDRKLTLAKVIKK